MDIIDPSRPLYNTIVFYILIICIILIIKPSFMYCHRSKKFKSFGLSDNQTIFSFPLIAISTGIVLYMIFLTVYILCKYLDEK
ncbi:MAG: hypothetical protein Homavirus37_3 [Homavirus sp.]|uniref:Uncharacterized protein n=1 Tax=Homavirus sp. TaxID=2487769 RepID=A0A3G5A785_9VIRU|nr:MAG: hypothetical protein Homavirus37_3 [Homavirus sp.]